MRLKRMSEADRAEVAHDIHDVVGQALTILKFDIAQVLDMIGSDRKSAAMKLEAMSELVDKTLAGVRRICAGLRPAVLDEGLVPALKWLAADMQLHTRIRFFVIGTDIAMPLDLATDLFRIVQETFTNIVRHARASSVYVTVKAREAHYIVAVRDDGKAFSRKKDALSGGLRGAADRLKKWNGRIIIRPSSGKGTWIFLNVPRPEPILRP